MMRLGLWLLASLLSLSLLHPAQAASLPPFTAAYDLRFGDALVGHAYFRLQRPSAQRYEFEAFTIPAGTMAVEDESHEILEVSQGSLLGGMATPELYYYSLRKGESTEILELLFDWNAGLLKQRAGDAEQTTVLEARSQDRLSYLLTLMGWAPTADNDLSFPLVEPTGSSLVGLSRQVTETLDLAVGSLATVRVDRAGPDGQIERRLWLAPALHYLPVRIERTTRGGTASMHLQRHRVAVDGQTAPALD